MSLTRFARQEVICLPASASVLEAAKLMVEKNIGCVVISEGRKPLGILTDRDITVRVTAEGLDPKTTKVNQAMTPDPVVLGEELGLFEALETMKYHAVRRFPVVDPEGNLEAFFSLDDVLYLFGLEMSAIARIIEQEGA
jgi:CBS domain-containing protein